MPYSIDARAGRILVEVGSCGGIPCANTGTGRLTQSDGANWSNTPQHGGAMVIGVLGTGFLAEAWDAQFLAYWPFNQPQEIGFHIRN